MPWGGRWPGWMTAVYSALDLYASVVLLIAASAVMGQGILCLCGHRAWSWLAPAVGLATLVILAGAAIRLPGDDLTATALVGLAIVAAIVVLWIRRPEAPGALRAGLPVAIAIVAVASIAFVAAGGFGAFEGKSNDLGYYLYDAQWLQTHAGFKPAHIVKGFPMGPPALAVVTSDAAGGASLVATFTAFTITVAVAGALASLAIFGKLGVVRRTIAAFLVGLPYMGASFFVQSSFKELAMGLFALAFALLLRELAGEDRPEGESAAGPLASVVPLALVAGAAVYTYSFAGTYWPVGTLGVWLVGSAVVGRERLRAQFRGWRLQVPRTRRARIIGAVAVVAVIAVAIPESNQVVEFARDRGSLSALSGGGVSGDLPGSPRVLTALGVWPVTDYRTAVPNLWAERILVAAALIVLARGLFLMWRRRELAILAATAAGVILYLAARIGSGPYVQSKAIAVMAPLIMLVAVFGALTALPGRRRVAAGSAEPGGNDGGGGRSLAGSLAWALVGGGVRLRRSRLNVSGARRGARQRRHPVAPARVAAGKDPGLEGHLPRLRRLRRLGVARRPGLLARSKERRRRPAAQERPRCWTRYDFDSMTPARARRRAVRDHRPQPDDEPAAGRTSSSSRPPTPSSSGSGSARRPPARRWSRARCRAICFVAPRRSAAASRALGDRRACGRVAPIRGLPADWRASSGAPASKGFRRPTALVPWPHLGPEPEARQGTVGDLAPVPQRRAGSASAGPASTSGFPPTPSGMGSFWPVGTIALRKPGTATFSVQLASRSGLRDLLAGPTG